MFGDDFDSGARYSGTMAQVDKCKVGKVLSNVDYRFVCKRAAAPQSNGYDDFGIDGRALEKQN